MAEWVGNVTKVFDGQGSKGSYKIVTVGGQDFFCFKDPPAKLEVGDFVKVNYSTKARKDGKGVVNIVESISSAEVPSVKAAAERGQEEETDKATQIKIAVLQVIGSLFFRHGPTVPQDIVIGMCDVLYEWASHKEEQNESEAEEVPF